MNPISYNLASKVVDQQLAELHKEIDRLAKVIKDKPLGEQAMILKTTRQALLTIKEAAK